MSKSSIYNSRLQWFSSAKKTHACKFSWPTLSSFNDHTLFHLFFTNCPANYDEGSLFHSAGNRRNGRRSQSYFMKNTVINGWLRIMISNKLLLGIKEKKKALNLDGSGPYEIWRDIITKSIFLAFKQHLEMMRKILLFFFIIFFLLTQLVSFFCKGGVL